MMTLLETVNCNGCQITIVISKVRSFVKADGGKLKVYYDNGEADTTVEDYEDFMKQYLNDHRTDVHFIGGRL